MPEHLCGLGWGSGRQAQPLEGRYLALFVVLKLFRCESATHPEARGGVGVGRGEAPGWVDLRRLWKQLHPIELWPAPLLGFKSASLAQVCTLLFLALSTPPSLFYSILFIFAHQAWPSLVPSSVSFSFHR